jgi:hypothetical protein
MSADHADYYRRRQEQERDRAARCAEPSVRAIHLELAARYGALAQTAEPPATLSPGLRTAV